MNPHLLAAVLANPDDDAPRLVLSDWLKENGQAERAEFIRIQIMLARSLVMGVHEKACDCAFCVLCRRERELLDQHGNQWSAIEGGKVILSHCNPKWHRGFIESITCTTENWIAHADTIMAAHPIRAVTLTTLPEIEELTIGRLMPEGKPDHPPRRLLGRKRWWNYEELVNKFQPRCWNSATLLVAEWPRISFELPFNP